MKSEGWEGLGGRESIGRSGRAGSDGTRFRTDVTVAGAGALAARSIAGSAGTGTVGATSAGLLIFGRRVIPGISLIGLGVSEAGVVTSAGCVQAPATGLEVAMGVTT